MKEVVNFVVSVFPRVIVCPFVVVLTVSFDIILVYVKVKELCHLDVK